MKWTEPTRIRNGDKRTRTGFLWIPRHIGQIWKWLEFAEWTEWYDEEDDIIFPWMRWKRIQWIEKKNIYEFR